MKLYLFDFDGTITTKDSMIAFFRFLHPRLNFYILVFKSIPCILLFILRIRRRDETKNEICRIFLSPIERNELSQISLRFAEFFTSRFMRTKALKYFEDLRKRRSKNVFIVTASLDIWIKPICEILKINCICTNSRFVDDRFFSIEGKNCINEEKVLRIQKKINLQNYSQILVYGDSSGDRAMMNIGTKTFYKYFE